MGSSQRRRPCPQFRSRGSQRPRRRRWSSTCSGRSFPNAPRGTRRDALRSAQRAEDPVQTKRVFSAPAISQEAAFPLLVVVRVEKVSLIAFSSLFTVFMRLIEIGQGYCFVGFLSFYIISF